MQVGIFDIFLALVPMGPILVSIDVKIFKKSVSGRVSIWWKGAKK